MERQQGPIGVVLCPTRELCQQVYIEIKRYARLYDVKVAALLGGENKQEQWKELRNGVDIIVATPGRLLDLYKKKATNFKRVTFLVLDEADKMLSLGFETQIKSIIGQIRPDRQVSLFSATFNDRVRDLCGEFLNDPVQVIVGRKNQANADIKQEFVVFEKLEDKMEWILDNVPQMMQQGKVLIFVNHIKSCFDLNKIFDEFCPEIEKLILHGDKMQHERAQIFWAFKKKANLLIATDIASRGLDIPSIKFVINYENPQEGETYVHRIGRTGRAGDKDGVAVSLLMRHETKFAAIVVGKLSVLGFDIPEDLRLMAAHDQEFKERHFKEKHGIKQDNDSTMLLKEALAAGQKHKRGIGFSKYKKNKEKGWIGQNQKPGEKAEELANKFKSMMDTIRAKEFEIEVESLKDDQSYVIQKKPSRFTEPGEEAKTPSEITVSAGEYYKLALDNMKVEMKTSLKSEFRSQFKKGQTLEAQKDTENKP